MLGAFRRYPGGTENAIILATLSREMLKCRAASRWLMPSAQASRTFRYKSTVKILPPSLSPERVKVDDFYAARSRLIPPLLWPTFAPPFSVQPRDSCFRRDALEQAKYSARPFFRREPGLNSHQAQALFHVLSGVFFPNLSDQPHSVGGPTDQFELKWDHFFVHLNQGT
jgi:hypothetical protein